MSNVKFKKAIMNKKSFLHKFRRLPNRYNWEAFRKQRNFCTDFRRKSVKAYFKERCYDGTKNTEFWPTIKPFVFNNGCKSEVDLTIEDFSSIITEPSVVASSMNTFFSNVESKIGCDLNPPDFNQLTYSI